MRKREWILHLDAMKSRRGRCMHNLNIHDFMAWLQRLHFFCSFFWTHVLIQNCFLNINLNYWLSVLKQTSYPIVQSWIGLLASMRLSLFFQALIFCFSSVSFFAPGTCNEEGKFRNQQRKTWELSRFLRKSHRQMTD